MDKEIEKNPSYVENEQKLNWFLGSFFAASILSVFIGNPSWISLTVTGIGFIALLWQLMIIAWRLKSKKNKEILYRRLNDGDYWRLFFSLYLSYYSIASISKGIFLLSLIFTVPFLFILVCISIVDTTIQKAITIRAIGCVAFAYFLFCWQKNALIEHYGVPIIGHFLEKRNYKAKYYVEARLENTSNKYEVLADLSIKSASETFDTGENRFGIPTSERITFKEIWIDRINLPDKGWSKVKQDETLSIEEETMIRDLLGRIWYIKITKNRIN
jgi:hypothetical protein